MGICMINEYGPMVLISLGIAVMIIGIAWQIFRWMGS